MCIWLRRVAYTQPMLHAIACGRHHAYAHGIGELSNHQLSEEDKSSKLPI